ncbi:MAG: hypothetical protein HC916_04915, partial [Coleofasciculaceae cyanobacterium SM2_1_6]|nr:hypothetical protein [Coleofasciculaceae cyanobacterium SM2_1_6]
MLLRLVVGLRSNLKEFVKDALWSMTLRFKYPSYIGYLALFVLAAGIEGDFDTKSYYPRLRKLLNEPIATGTYPDFSNMCQLWQGLERWANEEKSGELGVFTCRIIGNHRHIGLPLAQTLLSEKERRSLPCIFADANLDSIAPPKQEEVSALVSKHGRNHLLPRTLQLLKETNSNTNDVRQALLEIIIDELRDWDGYIEDSSSEIGRVYGSLSLCCHIDRVAGCVNFTLRCRTKREFPEDALSLKLENNQSFSCEEYSDGWSSPITTVNDQRLDASSLDWAQGVQMRSPDSKWCFRLPASLIRIFIDGNSEGLSGLVEVRQLPVQRQFYLAAHEDCLELLTEWGKSSCQGFEKLVIAHGLPNRWHFFRGRLACSDEPIKYTYPVMSFPNILRLELVGGIRVSRGNKFFKFAPPKLVLQGNNGSIQILCNDIPLDCDDNGIYELPLDSLELLIKAKRGEDTVRSASISLVDDISWQFKEINYRADRFGDRLTNSNDPCGITGTLVTDFDCPNFNFNTLLPIQGKQRVIFIGRKTGQISSSIPEDWTPVWIISKGRRSQVFFCGGNLTESEPISETCKDRKRLKEWKKLLWGERKTVYLPTQPDLRSLWKRFEKEAERV